MFDLDAYLARPVGLTTVLVGRSDLHESIQKHGASGVYFAQLIVPFGSFAPD